MHGDFSWPEPITAQWPLDLPRNASQNEIIALGELLLSRSREWWYSEISTPTWIVATLYEAAKNGVNNSVKTHAAATGAIILEVVADDRISGVEKWYSRSEIVERMTFVLGGNTPDSMLPDFCARVRAWHANQTKLNAGPPKSIVNSIRNLIHFQHPG